MSNVLPVVVDKNDRRHKRRLLDRINFRTNIYFTRDTEDRNIRYRHNLQNILIFFERVA